MSNELCRKCNRPVLDGEIVTGQYWDGASGDHVICPVFSSEERISHLRRTKDVDSAMGWLRTATIACFVVTASLSHAQAASPVLNSTVIMPGHPQTAVYPHQAASQNLFPPNPYTIEHGELPLLECYVPATKPNIEKPLGTVARELRELRAKKK